MIVYCKHITHARMHARSHRLTLANTHTPTHDRRCVGAAQP